MTVEILDPTWEEGGARFASAPRLRAPAGATVAIVSNGKRGTRPFFDAFERALIETFHVAEVVRLTKDNFSAPAERALLDDAERWNALVAGIGD